MHDSARGVVASDLKPPARRSFVLELYGEVRHPPLVRLDRRTQALVNSDVNNALISLREHQNELSHRSRAALTSSVVDTRF